MSGVFITSRTPEPRYLTAMYDFSQQLSDLWLGNERINEFPRQFVFSSDRLN